MKKVFAVVAHPDDEVLGCGGTIAKHSANGDNVSVVFMTDGVSSRPDQGKVEISARSKAMKKALKVLGVKRHFVFDFPDNMMDQVALLDVVKPLEVLIKRYRPEVIYTHHQGDLNVDHNITSRAVTTASRPVPGNSVKKILTFEVMSSTEWKFNHNDGFIPNCFTNIEEQLPLKIEALKAYDQEIHDFPHSRSLKHLEALAYHRGASVGFNAAEAFMLMREIVN